MSYYYSNEEYLKELGTEYAEKHIQSVDGRYRALIEVSKNGCNVFQETSPGVYEFWYHSDQNFFLTVYEIHCLHYRVKGMSVKTYAELKREQQIA